MRRTLLLIVSLLMICMVIHAQVIRDGSNMLIGMIESDGTVRDRSKIMLGKVEKDGYESFGDGYVVKCYKQLAAGYYRKCLNLDYYDGKSRVEKKLKD